MREGWTTALLVLGLFVSTPARAQSVRPSWSVGLGAEIDWVGGDDAHVILAADGRLERRRLADGALVAEQTIAGCGSLFPASRGERLSIHDPVREPGPHGLVVTCYGGTGAAPVHLVAAIDPLSLTVRWRLDGGTRAFTPIAERDGVVYVEWEDPGQRGGVLAIDAASGRVLWTVEVPRMRNDAVDLIADASGVLQVSTRGATSSLSRIDGHEQWRTTSEELTRFASLRGGVLVTAEQSVVTGSRSLDGEGTWRFAAASPISALVASGEDLVLVQSVLVGGGPPGELVALERDRGEPRWRRTTGSAQWVESAAGRVVVSSGAELLALDAATGAVLQRWPAQTLVGQRFDGRALLAAEGPDEPETRLQNQRLARFDLETGVAWRTRARIAALSPLIEHAGLVVACTDGGTVRAFDAATGRAAWQSAIGLRRPWPSLPCDLVLVGDHLVAIGAHDRVFVFDLAAPVRGGARVVVRGRVVGRGAGPGIHVLVGDAWTRTDAEGRFELPVRSAGPITVQIDLPDQARRCAHAEPVEVTPGAARRREVVLRLGLDYCACHPCD